MDEKLVHYLGALYPHIDVYGEWITFANTKVATQSISKGILNNRIIIPYGESRNWRVVWKELFRHRLDDVFMWTFVRNPWDRTLSAFLHVRKRVVSWRRIEFKDFAKTLLLERGVNVNSHFHLQSDNFLFNGEIIPEIFIGRFERLLEDWKYVAEMIGVSGRLPHKNKTEHSHYTEYYDDESREIVGALYKKEIEVLGYKYGE